MLSRDMQQQRGYNQPPQHHQQRFPSSSYLGKGERSEPRGAPPLPPPSTVIERSRDPTLVSEVVPVPPELLDWVSGSKVQAMFLKVKEASGISYITTTVDANGASIMIHSPTETAAKVARMLVEINFKEQIKYQRDMQRLHQMQESLFEVQGAVASGQRIEFIVPRDLVGIIIGKKGARIQEIQKETGISDIHIDGETGKITISGPSPSSVQRARELVDIVEEKVPLPNGRGELLARDFSSLNDIRDMSKCLIARVPPHEDCIVLIGTRSSITSAKLILETQMEYMMKRAQLYESEQSIRQQLSSLKGNKRENNQQNGNRGNYNSNNGRRRGNDHRDSAPQREREPFPNKKEAPPPPPPQRQSNNNTNSAENDRRKIVPAPAAAAMSSSSATPGTKGFSTAELQKKLTALAMGENGQKSSQAAAAPAPQKSESSKKGKGNQTTSTNKAEPANVEDGIHTSRRSRGSNPSSEPPTAAEPNSSNTKQKAPRGTVSNKVTKPNGRGDTLREAVEAKKS